MLKGQGQRKMHILLLNILKKNCFATLCVFALLEKIYKKTNIKKMNFGALLRRQFQIHKITKIFMKIPYIYE